MRVVLGHHGLRGDLALNLPAISVMHRDFGWDVDMPINRRFADMVPLFLNQPHLAGVFITDGYDDFPTARDREMLEAKGHAKVFHPMSPHRRDDWHQHMHQTDAVLFDYIGFPSLDPADRQIRLTKWFESPAYGQMVAFAPFAGFASNPDNDKRLSTERAQEVVDYVRSKGYDVLYLHGPGEPALEGTFSYATDYFKSVVDMLGCKALIHTDTGMGWFASAYQHPQLGLYGHRYYGAANVKHIQPVNPNAIYLDAPAVADLTMDQIRPAIDQLLS